MSTKRSLQSVTLVLVVFTIFTVSLTETIQISDGLSMSATRLIYEVQVGETQMLTWSVQNNREDTSMIEFRAEGKGSEYLVFEKFIEAGPNEIIENEIYLSVPEDHPDNVEYRVKLFALQKGELPGGGQASGAVVNVQVLTNPIIKIGDNPIFNQEVIEQKIEEKQVEEKEESETIVEEESKIVEEVGESVADKLAAIKAANTAVMGETPAQATGQFEVEDPVSDYVPEPGVDADLRTEINPVGTFSEKVECNFFEVFLSWFGIGKC